MSEVIGAWVAFLPTLLIAVALLGLPGLALGWGMRLRGWWLAAAAAPLSVSLIVVASIIAGWLAVPWSVWPVVLLTVVAVIAAGAWMRWVGVRPNRARRSKPGASRVWATVVSVAAPVLVIGTILARGIGDPSRIAQRYDNFFHLNAIQFVLDTGGASPFWVGSMTAPGNLLFYPSGWHAVGSLIAQLAGTGVPEASNALVIVVAAVVWPLSAILLARTLFGRAPLVTVAAGAMSAATPAFPLLPLHYGTLYPLFLGLSLAPVAIAALIRAARPHRMERRQDHILLLVLLIPGVAVSHPGALLAVLALGVPVIALLGWWLWRNTTTIRGRVWIAGGAAGLIALGMLTLVVVRPPVSEIYWSTTGSLATAIGEALTGAVYGYQVAYLFAALMLTGVVVAIVRPTFGRSIALGMALVGVVLYVVVAGSPFEFLRTWLTGPWYNNAPRLASIWALAMVPMAAHGAAYLARVIARRARATRMFGSVARRLPAPVAFIVFAAVLVALSQTSALRQASADVNYVYGEGGDGPILSAGEYDLIDELGDLVPEDAVIAGDPWTGTSFAYGISGRQVLMPHLLMDETPAAAIINRGFAFAGDNEQMCDALRETGARYILDFDGPDLMDNEGGFDGVTDLRNSTYVELVESKPGARLYEITTCELN